MFGLFLSLLAGATVASSSDAQAIFRPPPDRTPVVIPDVDNDAACVIGLTIELFRFQGKSAADKAKSALTAGDLTASLDFYSGSLARQYKENELAVVMPSARRAIVALPALDHERLVIQCLASKALRVVVIRRAIVS